MKNPYSCCCCFLPKPHQFPSPPQPSLWLSSLPCFCFYGSRLFSEASDLSRPLSCSVTTWSSFFPPFCQRLQGALLTRVAGLVAVENWLVSFTSSGGPPSAFLLVFIRRPQVCRFELQEIPKSEVPYVMLRPWVGSRLSQDSSASPPTPTPSVSSSVYC